VSPEYSNYYAIPVPGVKLSGISLPDSQLVVFPEYSNYYAIPGVIITLYLA
jgi:hypothetical protein